MCEIIHKASDLTSFCSASPAWPFRAYISIISRVMYFNGANLNLHLSPKWSKIKVQKIFKLFFEYKTLESSGQELWTDDGYSTGYSKPQLGTTPSPFPSPISLPYWEQWFCWCFPHPTSSSSTQSLRFPQGLLHPYPESISMPQEGFFFSLDFLIPYLQAPPKAGCKHRAQPLPCFGYTQLTQELLQGY